MRLNQSKYLNYLLRIIDGIKLTPSVLAGPVHLQIEPVSGICNLNCRICDTKSKEKKELSFEEFKKILDSFPFCLDLKLTGNGESILVKDFFKMIEYAKTKNLKVSFYTNMTLVDENVARRLIELSVDEIFISIDSSYPMLFERIRSGANYSMVIDNIKQINKLKKEYNSIYPELHFATVAMKENIDGIPDLVRLASELKIKGVVVHHLGIKDAELAMPQQSFMDNPLLALYYFRKAEQIAREKKISFKYPLFSFRKKNRLSICQQPWINCQIDPWGYVYPCCRLRKSFGNIFKQQFSSIWNGEDYRRLRRLVATRRLPCPQCEANILSLSREL